MLDVMPLSKPVAGSPSDVRKSRNRRLGAAFAGLLVGSIAPFVGLSTVPAGAAGPAAVTAVLYTNNDGGPPPIFASQVYSVTGEPVALVAVISAADGSALKPTGTVTFKDGETVLSSPTLADGVAVHLVELAAGPHAFTAAYSGDTTYQAAATNPVNQTAQTECSVTTGELGFPGPSVFVDGMWYQRTAYASGGIGKCFAWGAPGQLPVLGDWDRDGRPTIGVYDRGTWFLSNHSKSGPSDVSFVWGSPGMIPVSGDWDGDGRDTIGLYKDGVWYLRNSNTPGGVDITIAWGVPDMIPVVGDWDGDGKDTIGGYSRGTWYLRNSNTPGGVDTEISWGGGTDQPISGDWDGDGKDTIGVFSAGAWSLRNTNSGGGVDVSFTWGGPGMIATPGR